MTNGDSEARSSGARPVSAVLGDILGNLEDIARGELRLAKTEVRAELKQARAATLLVLLGALGCLLGAFFVLLAVVNALTLVIPAWAAALIVGVVVGIPAVAIMHRGSKLSETPVGALPRTAASLKENVKWAKPPTR